MFYSVYLSKDNLILSWRMSTGLRVALAFAFLSVSAVLFRVLASGDFTGTSPFGRVNLILLPFLLFLGVLYEDSIVLNRKDEWLETRTGLIFLKRIRRWKAEDLTGIEYRTVRGSGKTDNTGPAGNLRVRVFFAFQMRNQLVILDRSCRPGKAETWLRAFQAFWPRSVDVVQ